MHIPKQFEQNESEFQYDIIQKYPFANLVTHSDSGLEVNHIPFFLARSDGKNVLQGHIAKVNPLWEKVKDKSDVLVVFNGPNCYISPNYYPTKKQTGKAVPTWNYVTVHVKGKISFIHDKKWNLNMIDALTNLHEAGQTTPWSLSDAPEKYIHKLISVIVGLEIEISSITGQWKLSQNQPEQNKQGVVTGLSQEGKSYSQEIVELIKQHAIKLD